MTFALFCFHLLILLLIMPRNGCASVIHDSGWVIKTIIVFALFIGFFWIPISFFQVWAEISRYISILFMLLMVLYILIGAYSFNEYMIDAATTEEEGSAWKIGTLLVLTIIMTTATVALIIGCFFWFNGGSTDMAAA